MDGVTLHDRILKGRAKAALHIGMSCDVYRPSSASAPLGTHVTTLKAAFNARDPGYTKPNLYGNPVWYADLDGRQTQEGDYLVRQSDSATWFIAAQQQLLPIVAVACDRSVKVQRQPAASTVGAVGYGGLTAPADVLGSDAHRWPAAIFMGGRALNGSGLPAGVKEGGWKILLPPSVPITLLAGDLVHDDLGRRYAVESAELTDLGWRLTANDAHA